MEKREFAAARRILGKTQKEMAQLLGTSLKAVSSYEQGWRSIPVHIERQIYFFLSRMAGVNEALHPCWEVNRCADKVREGCPAWQFNVGRLCWFINGTFCEKCLSNSPRNKIEMCKNCEAFRPIAKMLNEEMMKG